jgi:uncharacterized protein (DUF2062 family)
MFRKRLRRWLPRPDAVLDHPWVLRLGPALQHPHLWHIGRRSVALGAAVGLFFGILLPIGQIPSAAVLAVALRANIATAIAGTFVTNAVTYVPVYLAAYVLGCFLTGQDPAQLVGLESGFAGVWESFESLASTSETLLSIVAPFFLGTLVLAILSAAAGYFGIQVIWSQLVRRARRRRRLSPGASPA